MSNDGTTARSASYWFAPEPDGATGTRLRLDFGVRAADLFFRELVVPGIGGIWYVRQIAWPLASLRLHQRLRERGERPPRPSIVANAVEALACKLEFHRDATERSERILGTRAFGRDPNFERGSFADLQRGDLYVRNTYRQVAVRALRVESGLGFVRGPRFDRLQFEPVGLAMANAILEQRAGRSSLGAWLERWVPGDRDLSRPTALLAALSPKNPTATERDLVRARLFDTDGAASEKRRALRDALADAGDPLAIEEEVVPHLRRRGQLPQAQEILAARSFGALLDRSTELVAPITTLVEPARRGVTPSSLTTDRKVAAAAEGLRLAARAFLRRADEAVIVEATSRAYALEIQSAGDDATLLERVVARVPRLLSRADGAIARGPLFRVLGDDGDDDADAIPEPDRTGRTFRIANFHSLLQDLETTGGVSP